MGAFSAKIRTRASSGAFLLAGLVLLPLPGCEEKTTDNDSPTEPWLKDEAERKRNEAPSRLRYQLAPGASLSVALPTRRSKPTGRISRIRGEVELDLKELALSRGRIIAELDSLEMNDLPPPDKLELVDQAPELFNAATKEAHRWLGLGEDVPVAERRKHQQAVFEFDSLRALSHPSAHTGSLRKSKGSGRSRQVYATADGELSLRGFAVRRQFSTTLLFHYPDKDAQIPHSVEVTLRSGVTIPLSEYEIVPRGAEGHEDTKRRDIVGQLVGSQVKVTGTLEFSRPGVLPPEKDTEKP